MKFSLAANIAYLSLDQQEKEGISQLFGRSTSDQKPYANGNGTVTAIPNSKKMGTSNTFFVDMDELRVFYEYSNGEIHIVDIMNKIAHQNNFS